MRETQTKREAIVFSSWDWKTFNVPERVAAALALRGFRVLYCEMPVSRFRRRSSALHEVFPGVQRFCPEYLGRKAGDLPFVGNWQWGMVAEQIQKQAESLGMRKADFFYSHVDGIAPLCREMRARGSRLLHICMDYPEAYQYELIDLSDRTLVIPKTVFHKLQARYGEKIEWIPQSIQLSDDAAGGSNGEPAELAKVPRPRLGYLGPIFARLNLPLLRSVLRAHPEWQFVCFGDSAAIALPNVRSAGWRQPEALPAYVASFDVGVMPYDCFDEKNLHCVPLKLLDYFAAGLPVASTSILSLQEVADLVYVGDTPADFGRAIEEALAEPAGSPKRGRRMQYAREHSTLELGKKLEAMLDSQF